MAKHRKEREPLQIKRQTAWILNKWRYFTKPRLIAKWQNLINAIDRYIGF